MNENIENACDCGHGVGWHQDTRGCGYKGFNPRHKCPCSLLPYEAVNAVVNREKAKAWDEGANAAVQAVNTGTRMTLRARIPFPADENPYRVNPPE